MPVKKPTSPIKATTQQFIEIEDIQGDIMIMKDNSAVIVVEAGAVNFFLLSQEEQDSMIYAFGSLLNSLSFPVQILILSKRMDISSYIDYVNGKISSQRNEVMRARLISYLNFIKTIVKKNTVLEKRFFFVIPFSRLELGAAAASGKNFSKEYVLTRAQTALYPKRDHLLRLLSRVGLKPSIMQKQELVELFYNVYNPSSTGKQLAPIDSYTDTILTSG